MKDCKAMDTYELLCYFEGFVDFLYDHVPNIDTLEEMYKESLEQEE